ncbi:P-loop containing nucleoside triphosphate hydrolase protein [Cercophora newfieldiana]|uniref:P-loop containing nucleoside triphosphate hydrolase protein n=1 Tax=Cercophora newfieldiana TaxID=92897 RepID=A0AA40CP09_9PEZI|nr:P-loop containing nucleoside triphosphate hydrolase protein [Cercophora newfieldiana]
MQYRKSHQFTILLIGVTGAGKSTFAACASGKEVEIGHSIDPCTQDPEAVCFQLGNDQIILIDTPGFDDTERTDIEILQALVKWIPDQPLLKNQLIDGLILFHPVTRNIVSDDERRRTQLLKTLLGDDAYKRVTIATTMWDSLDPGYAAELEAELSTTSKNNRLGEGGVWGEFCQRGATVARHDNNEASAHKIIQQIINRCNEVERSGMKRHKDANRNVITFGPSFFKQLIEDLENEIASFDEIILEYRDMEPELPFDRSPSSEESQRWNEWEDQRIELERMLNKRHAHIKMLRTGLSWVGRLGKIWMSQWKFLAKMLGQ